jgi:hypothetical protein
MPDTDTISIKKSERLGTGLELAGQLGTTPSSLIEKKYPIRYHLDFILAGSPRQFKFQMTALSGQLVRGGRIVADGTATSRARATSTA